MSTPASVSNREVRAETASNRPITHALQPRRHTRPLINYNYLKYFRLLLQNSSATLCAMESTFSSRYKTSTIVNVHQRPVSPEPTTASLLGEAAHHQNTPRDWPSAPNFINPSVWTNIWSGIVDITLFGFSVAFLAFALIINSYDKVTTHAHPRAKENLVSASKYVRR